MQARKLPLQRGWAWLREGFMLWRRNPALLTFASFGYLLILVLISSVPLLGQAIASLIMPVLSLGVLNTCRAIDEGRKGGPDLLFSGFKSNVPALVTIGGFYLVGSVLVILLTSATDGGALIGMMRGEFDPESGEVPDLGFSVIVAMILSAPVIMAYWFAPILAGWWKISAPKAMFFSFYACLQNWRPFLAYGISLAVVGGIVPGLLIGTIGAVIPLLGQILMLLVPLVLVPAIFASFYINAREVFATVSVDERIED
ncbi:BPSS1780 family membrane protein [Rhodocyclaceae bacterium SMB388]